METCQPNFDKTSSKYTCSNGALQVSQYSDGNCKTLSSGPSLRETGKCVSGRVQACVSAGPAPAPTPPTPPISYVNVQTYATADCTGPLINSNIYVQGACIDNYDYVHSGTLTCSNNIAYGNKYTGSSSCSGTPSTKSYSTCTR